MPETKSTLAQVETVDIQANELDLLVQFGHILLAAFSLRGTAISDISVHLLKLLFLGSKSK